jgi:hypothetical protein
MTQLELDFTHPVRVECKNTLRVAEKAVQVNKKIINGIVVIIRKGVIFTGLKGSKEFGKVTCPTDEFLGQVNKAFNTKFKFNQY